MKSQRYSAARVASSNIQSRKHLMVELDWLTAQLESRIEKEDHAEPLWDTFRLTVEEEFLFDDRFDGDESVRGYTLMRATMLGVTEDEEEES